MAPWRPEKTVRSDGEVVWVQSPNREFRRVSEVVWREYHRRLKEIRSSWLTDPLREVEIAPGYSRPEYDHEVEERFEFNARMREVERENLRVAVEESLRLGYLVDETGKKKLDEHGLPVSPHGPHLLPTGPRVAPRR